MSKGRALTYDERKYIEKSIKDGKEIIEIAYKLEKSITTIYREIERGFTGEINLIYGREYSAELGQKTYMENKMKCGRKSL